MFELITDLAISETNDMEPIDELETILRGFEYTLTATQFKEVVEMVTAKLKFYSLAEINADLSNQFDLA